MARMTKAQRDALTRPPPADQLHELAWHDGRPLLYLEFRYVAETLNVIFGPDGWSRQFAGGGLTLLPAQTVKRGRKMLHIASAMCEYRLIAGPAVAEDVGFGRSDPMDDPGAATEQAAKVAVTDALKRCARTLGAALGLCLYDRAWLSGRAASAPRATRTAKPRTPRQKWRDVQKRIKGGQGHA